MQPRRLSAQRQALLHLLQKPAPARRKPAVHIVRRVLPLKRLCALSVGIRRGQVLGAALRVGQPVLLERRRVGPRRRVLGPLPLAEQMQPRRRFCATRRCRAMFGMLPASLVSGRRRVWLEGRRGGAPAQFRRRLSAVLDCSLPRRVSGVPRVRLNRARGKLLASGR
jgi:hypothetical protein